MLKRTPSLSAHSSRASVHTDTVDVYSGSPPAPKQHTFRAIEVKQHTFRAVEERTPQHTFRAVEERTPQHTFRAVEEQKPQHTFRAVEEKQHTFRAVEVEEEADMPPAGRSSPLTTVTPIQILSSSPSISVRVMQPVLFGSMSPMSPVAESDFEGSSARTRSEPVATSSQLRPALGDAARKLIATHSMQNAISSLSSRTSVTRDGESPRSTTSSTGGYSDSFDQE
jgi:hypothetical protein